MRRALLLLCLASIPLLADDRVDDLISRLGHDDWATREQATSDLIDVGDAALPALERALGHEDPEVQMRAREAITAIETGLNAKAYRDLGNFVAGYEQFTAEQKALLWARLRNMNRDGARPFAKLASIEPDAATRARLVDEALLADAPAAIAALERFLEKKLDHVVVVKIASHHRRAGRNDAALEWLARLGGRVDVPVDMAREAADLYVVGKRWAEAAGAYGALADRVPDPSEAEAAGDRLAFLALAGDEAGYTAALGRIRQAGRDVQAIAFTRGMDRLEGEGQAERAMGIATDAMAAGVAGPIPGRVARFLMAAGREHDALLVFRFAVKSAPDEGTMNSAVEDLRRAYAGAGGATLATMDFAREIKEEHASPPMMRALAASQLMEAGLSGAAAVEWKKVCVLFPGAPGPVLQVARALASSGDPRALAWAEVARLLLPGLGVEALLAGAPRGKPSRTVLQAIPLPDTASAALLATSGRMAAVGDVQVPQVFGVDDRGLVAWTWTWPDTSQTEKVGGTSAIRTRRFRVHHLLPAADAFLVAVVEIDELESMAAQVDDSRYAGQWLVLLDAATGAVRSRARATGVALDSDREAVVHAGVVVTTQVNGSILEATEIATGRTAWVRLVDRYSTATDPFARGISPRLAVHRDLVLVPSAHGARVRAFRAADGEPAWATALPGPSRDLVLVGDVALVAAGDHAAALDAATGRVLWTAKTGGDLACAPVEHGGSVVARSTDGWLRGLDPATGSEKWKTWIGPVAGFERAEPAGPLLFLLRQNGPTWALAAGGAPVRRLQLDFLAPPVAWNRSLVAINLLRRRRPLHAPQNAVFETTWPTGLVRLDPAALAEGDAAALAALASRAPAAAAPALCEAGLALLDPDSPDLRLLRAKTSPPAFADRSLEDALRALDALPPQDPRWDAALDLSTRDGKPLRLDVQEGRDDEPWVREHRAEAAIARLRRNPADIEAALALGESGLAGAVAFLQPRPGQAAFNQAAAIARLRLGDATAVPDAADELRHDVHRLRLPAARALRGRKEPEALAALREALVPEMPLKVRLEAALAIGPEGDDVALKLLETYGLVADERDVFLLSAQILLDKGRKKAVDLLARADDPGEGAADLPGPYEMLARATLPEAREALERIAVDRSASYAFHAASQLSARHPDRAHAVLHDALRRNAWDPGVELDMLLLFSPGEHPEVAPLVAERIGRLFEDPADVGRQKVGHRLVLIDALDASGQGDSARSHLDFYGSLFPDTAAWNNNGAWYRAIAQSPELKNGPRALELALKAVAGEPSSSSYWDTLAESFRACGHFATATRCAEWALAIAPLDGDTCDVAYCAKQLARMRAFEASGGASDGTK